jgi:DNA polymerase III delta subunit
MNRDLENIIAAIRKGRAPSLLLLFGNEFQVEEVCKHILDLMVPQSHRAFNLERFDGGLTAWDRIEAALNTPPFLSGRKVVWVENAPYFFSREKKSDLSERVLQVWTEGRKDAAGELLMDLLSVEGWTNEQWEQVASRGSLGPLSDLLGAEHREEAEQLIAHCKSMGIQIVASRGSEEHGLSQLLDVGLPPWGFLLLTAAQVDRRTRLYKRIEEMTVAFYVGLERERSGRVSQDALLDFIHQRLRHAGKTIESRAREMILVRAGEDVRGLQQELDKLFLYVGDQPAIHVEDVEAIFTDQGEGWVFDLTRSIGDRDPAAALCHLARLLAQGEPPLKLLGTIVSEVRKLLAARQLIEGELRGRWRRDMSYQQFQQTVTREGDPLLTRNPYADYMSLQRAERFSLRELRFHLAQIYATDVRLKSSGNPPRLAMERLILNMCCGWQTEKGRDDSRTNR